MDLGRGAKAVVMLAALIVVFAGVKLAQELLVPLLLAAFLTTISAPVVLWLTARGLGPGLSVLATMLLVIGLLAGVGVLFSESVSGFYERVPTYQTVLDSRLTETAHWVGQFGLDETQVEEVLSPDALIAVLADLFKGVADLLSNLLLVLLIVGFMLFEAVGLRHKLGNIVASPTSLDRLSRAASEVNKYLAVKTATSLLTGVTVGIWFVAWGVDFPVLWALLAFVLAYVPTIGSFIAGIPPITLAVIQLGPGEGFGVALGYVALNFAIGNILEPRILGRTLGLSPLVVFVSMVFWGWLLGPVGAVLAVPLTMLVRIALANTNDLAFVAVLLGPVGEAREEAKRTSLAPPPMPAPEPEHQPTPSTPPGE